VPWSLAVCVLIGIWLMFTRLALGTEGSLANADHLVGAMAVTVAVIAMAEIGRAVRLLNVPLGLGACLVPFILGGTLAQIALGLLAGLGLIVCSIPRGDPIRKSYGASERMVF